MGVHGMICVWCRGQFNKHVFPVAQCVQLRNTYSTLLYSIVQALLASSPVQKSSRYCCEYGILLINLIE